MYCITDVNMLIMCQKVNQFTSDSELMSITKFITISQLTIYQLHFQPDQIETVTNSFWEDFGHVNYLLVINNYHYHKFQKKV